MTLPIPTNDQLLIPSLLTALNLVVSLTASTHVVLTKRDTKAAIGWIGLIWLSPFLGTAIYVVLGINRINRRARSLRRDQPRSWPRPSEPGPYGAPGEALTSEQEHLDALAELVGRVTGRPLLAGNEIVPLGSGEATYPAMLEAIDAATRTIALGTYIFNDDLAGKVFV